MPANPFDYLNAINTSKVDLIREAPDPTVGEKEYPAFMVNRGLSYFIDTVMYANDTNQWAHLDATLQNDYLLASIPKKKRFSKWAKAQKDDQVQMVMKYFGYSRKKADAALKLLTPEQLVEMEAILDPGGRS